MAVSFMSYAMVGVSLLLYLLLSWQQTKDPPLPTAPPGQFAFDPRDLPALLAEARRAKADEERMTHLALRSVTVARAREKSAAEGLPAAPPTDTVMVKKRWSLAPRAVSRLDAMNASARADTLEMGWLMQRVSAGGTDMPPALARGHAFPRWLYQLDRALNYVLVAAAVERRRVTDAAGYERARAAHPAGFAYLYNATPGDVPPEGLAAALGIDEAEAAALADARSYTQPTDFAHPPWAPPAVVEALASSAATERRATVGPDAVVPLPVPVHVILAPEGGDGAVSLSSDGVDELRYVHAAMRHRVALPTLDAVGLDGRPSEHPFAGACGGLPHGSPAVHAAARGLGAEEWRRLVDRISGVVFGFVEKGVMNPLTSQLAADRSVFLPILAVRTGASPAAVARCTAAILDGLPMFRVKSITLLGAGGVSPVVGPAWDGAASNASADAQQYWKQEQLATVTASGSGDAAAARAARAQGLPDTAVELYADAKVALGSVCVTHAAALTGCGTAADAPAATAAAPSTEILAAAGGGDCDAHAATARGAIMVESMKAALMTREPGNSLLPPVPPAVAEGVRRYWAAQEALPEHVPAFSKGPAGPAVHYEYNRDPPAVPRVLHCIEADPGAAEWGGAAADAACRAHTRRLLNAELRQHYPNGTAAASQGQRRRRAGAEAPEWPSERLACVQAGGAYGLFYALAHDPRERVRRLPAAVVRGASHYTVPPMRRRRVDGPDGETAVWEPQEGWMAEEELRAHRRAAHQYAIATASSAVLHYFMGARSPLPPDTDVDL